MRSSDIGKSLLIFLIFIILYMFSVWSAGIADIKKNWTLYRCNPMIMPFASNFGYDTGENFTQCIQNMQSAYMGDLLQPVEYNIKLLGSNTGIAMTAINDMRKFFSKLRTLISTITQDIYGVFGGVIIEYERILLTLKDIFGKFMAVMVVQIYAVGGVMITGQSLWDGPPGELARFLCFHPDTLIKLKNNTLIKMKDVPLNSELKNGAIVQAVMNISNIDSSGEYKEQFYTLPDGEKTNNIYVTGHHLIFDPLCKNYIKVKDFKDATLNTELKSDTLAWLITSNHTIPIGTRLFHDWEDNQP